MTSHVWHSKSSYRRLQKKHWKRYSEVSISKYELRYAYTRSIVVIWSTVDKTFGEDGLSFSIIGSSYLQNLSRRWNLIRRCWTEEYTWKRCQLQYCLNHTNYVVMSQFSRLAYTYHVFITDYAGRKLGKKVAVLILV